MRGCVRSVCLLVIISFTHSFVRSLIYRLTHLFTSYWLIHSSIRSTIIHPPPGNSLGHSVSTYSSKCLVQPSIGDSSHPPVHVVNGSCETTNNASPFLRKPRRPSVPPSIQVEGGICTWFLNSVRRAG